MNRKIEEGGNETGSQEAIETLETLSWSGASPSTIARATPRIYGPGPAEWVGRPGHREIEHRTGERLRKQLLRKLEWEAASLAAPWSGGQTLR